MIQYTCYLAGTLSARRYPLQVCKNTIREKAEGGVTKL